MVPIRPGGLRKLFSWASEGADPLRSRAGAENWIRGLPAAGATERAQQIVHLLSEPRPEQESAGRGALEALFEIDAAAAPLARLLTRQFVIGVARRDQIAITAWTAAFELAQSLAGAYRVWLDRAPDRGGDRTWVELFVTTGARYLHYRALERRLRALRYEQWIPGKWRELYSAYEAVCRFGGEQRTVGGVGGQPMPSAETELVKTLIQELLHRGSFGIVEIDWATRYLNRWLPRLRLLPAAKSGAAWIDLKATSGLRRHVAGGAAPPAGVLYVDIHPIVERLQARKALRAGRPPAAPGRIVPGAADKLLAVLENFLGGQRARAPRAESQATARVVVGLDATLVNLAFSRGRSKGKEIEMGYELRRPLPRFVELNWPPPGSVPAGGLAVLGRIRDVSETGVRVALPAQEWGLRSIGELIGVQEAETVSWRIGVVRRLVKPRSDSIEVGIELLTTTPTWVRLTDLDVDQPVASLANQEAGSAVYGVFVPPGRLARPALLLPSAACVDGRRLAMPTAHAVYQLSVARIVERGPEWAMAEVNVLGKSLTQPSPASALGSDRAAGS